MIKSLQQVFNQKQLDAIRTKIWWVADRQKPYFMKFSLDQDFILLELTDFKSFWANKFHIKTLLEQKNKFARSLQIKQDRDLLLLFESLLSTSDPQARYLFNELKGSEINFTFNKRINIFDFKWTFKLLKVNYNTVELICREILNPLGTLLDAQVKRIQMLRKRFDLIEKDYIRKMSEMEKTLYKSPLIEDADDWKLLIPKNDGKMLNFIKFDQVSKFFYKNYMSQQKQKVNQSLIVFQDQRKNKEISRVMNNTSYQLAEHQLLRRIQKESLQQKREKKLDFI